MYIKKWHNAVSVYVLEDPSGVSQTVYIGQTNDPGKRLAEHLTPSHLKSRTHKNNWIRSLLLRGVTPQFTVLETVPAGGDYDESECFHIAYFRSLGMSLCNGTDGGDGLRGLKRTAEHTQKIARALRGRKHSVEQRAKQSIARKGLRCTPEQRAKQSELFAGVKNPAAKLSEHDVRTIRLMYGKGGTSLRSLATDFGVSKRAVQFIVQRVHWKDVV